MARRQRPRRGGPDYGKGFAADFAQAECASQRGVVFKAISHIHGGRDFVFIFHFGFSQRRAAIKAELHWFFTAIKIACQIDFAQSTHGFGFSLEIHGEIWVRPIAHHAQAHKVFFLTRNLLFGIFAAQFAKAGGGNIFAVQLFHHQFDGQAVAIPAGHIRRIKARQRFAAQNDVFQNFVGGMTDVDIAVGIGRAVVQNEFRPALGDFAQLFIAFVLIPAFQPAAFAFGQIAAHGKRAFEQVYGFAVIGHFVFLVLRYVVSDGLIKHARPSEKQEYIVTELGRVYKVFKQLPADLRCHPMAGGIHIGPDLRLQRVDAVELFFVTQFVQKAHIQTLAV